MCNCIAPVICNECVPCVDCLPPAIVTPCFNGEQCPEASYVDCVIYRGEDLDNINVKKKDRLDIILKKLNINHEASAINTEDTHSINFTGTGLLTDPLKSDVILDPDPDNITNITSNGLLTKFTKNNVLKLFQIIQDDIDLQVAFCRLVGSCYNTGTCGLVTDLNADLQ